MVSRVLVSNSWLDWTFVMNQENARGPPVLSWVTGHQSSHPWSSRVACGQLGSGERERDLQRVEVHRKRGRDQRDEGLLRDASLLGLRVEGGTQGQAPGQHIHSPWASSLIWQTKQEPEQKCSSGWGSRRIRDHSNLSTILHSVNLSL